MPETLACDPETPAMEPRTAHRVETTVLIVDDSPIDRRLATRLVEKLEGWEIEQACNGVEALEMIRRHPPAIVLTDMLMPEMDGLELVKAIRERHPLIPVIVMTAFGSEDIAIKALQTGAASYVPKKSRDRPGGDARTSPHRGRRRPATAAIAGMPRLR
jgi:CheY-like chemotaxis protein